MSNIKTRHFTDPKCQEEVGELLVYDEIGYWGIDAKTFADAVKSLGNVDRILVRINSPGGNAFDGQTMYNTLRQHKAAVTVDVDGVAASAASIIAMAGDTVRMADNAFLMIHESWGSVVGDVAAIRRYAGLMDTLNENMVDTYANRRNIDRDAVAEWVAAETWFSATEALEAGMIDEVTGDLAMAASVDKNRYRNTPTKALTLKEFKLPAHNWKAVADAREREIELTRAGRV